MGGQMIRVRSRSTVWMGGAEIPRVKSTARIGRRATKLWQRRRRLAMDEFKIHPTARSMAIIPSMPLNCSKRTKNRSCQPIKGHWNGLAIDFNTLGRPQRTDERIEGKGRNHPSIPIRMQLQHGTNSIIHRRAQSPPCSSDGTTMARRTTNANPRCAAHTPRRRRSTIPKITAHPNLPSVRSPASSSAASSPPSACTSPSPYIASARSRTLWGWIPKCPMIR
mmetsp:Transcript_31502/g.65935  ORF Transcript_31502/g.65935 Transcript_31502/m.65935 type:complete len:222 (+) Transcript_31502:1283-1948(+)